MTHKRLTLLLSAVLWPLAAFVLAVTWARPATAVTPATTPGQATMQSPSLAEISEMTGMVASITAISSACTYDQTYQLYLCPEPNPGIVAPRDPATAARAREMLYGGGGLLLIPDSTNDRIMAFDPMTGDLVDADFIPADPVNMATPKNAILSASGNSVLVSDQIRDTVAEYDLDGNFMGIFAPAGGANPAILDNIIGIALRPNGNLLVTVTGGANQDSVAEFDTAGNYLGNFVANGAGGMDGPFDIYQRTGDWLVGNINSDDINRHDLATGDFLDELAPINSFPQQLAETPGGNILVGNFSGTQTGVMELTPAGAVVGIYNPGATSGYRGVYELPNGNLLTTTGTGVHEIDRLGNLIETKIGGLGAQYIEFIQTGDPSIAVEPVTLASLQPPEVQVTVPLTIHNAGLSTLDWTIEEAAPVTSPPCDTPGDIPWLAVSPGSGTTPAGTTSAVDVTFDSTGLAVNTTYTGTLCIDSNDPTTPLVTVPVTLTVVPAVYGVEVAAEDANLSGAPGTSVVYAVWISNTGNVQDSFELTATGTWTTTPAVNSVTLGADASTSVTVTVHIPGDADDGDTDVATFTATSQTDGSATDSVDLTTTAVVTPAHGVEVATTDADLSGVPDATVEYTVWITNTGNVSDSFNLTVTGVWTTTPAVDSVTLGADASTSVTVTVHIPGDADDGDTDVATFTATSQADASATDFVVLTTTAVMTPTYGVEVGPDAELSGEPGAAVVYTVWITNTGNVQDTFNLSISGNDWTTTPEMSSIILGAGVGVSVMVTVNIPGDAGMGDMDVATLTAVSQTDGTTTDSARLTTTVIVSLPIEHRLYLPIIMKP